MKRSKGKKSGSLTASASVDLMNTKLHNLQRTSSLVGFEDLLQTPALIKIQDKNPTTSRLKKSKIPSAPSSEKKIAFKNRSLSCQESSNNPLNNFSHSIQSFSISDASSTEGSEVSYEDDYSRGSGAANAEPSTTSYKPLKTRLNRKKAPLLSRGRSVNYSVDITEESAFSSNVSKDTHESSPPQKQCLLQRSRRVTREIATLNDGDGESADDFVSRNLAHSACATPVNIPSTTEPASPDEPASPNESASPDESSKVEPSEQLQTEVVERKCRPERSLKEQRSVLELTDVKINYLSSSPLCNDEDGAADQIIPHCHSEGSIVSSSPSNSSHFKAVYVRDMNYCKSQKPNVETVDEEEESHTRTKADGVKEVEAKESIQKCLVSSTCTGLLHSDENEAPTERVQEYYGSEAEQNVEQKKSHERKVEEVYLLKSNDQNIPETPCLQKPSEQRVAKRRSSPMNETVCNTTYSAGIEKSSSPEELVTEVSSLSGSDSEVQLEPTGAERQELVSGWQPHKSASVESEDCLTSPTNLNDISVVMTENDSDLFLLDESTATLVNSSKTPTPEQYNRGTSHSLQDTPTFLSESLSPFTSELQSSVELSISPTERSMSQSHSWVLLPNMPKPQKKRTSAKNRSANDISGKSVRELSKIFEFPPKSSDRRNTSPRLHTSKEKMTATTEVEDSIDNTLVNEICSKLKSHQNNRPLTSTSPTHRLFRCTCPEVKVKAKQQQEVEKQYVSQKRKETVSKIPVTRERRSRGLYREDSNGKVQPPDSLAADRILPPKQLQHTLSKSSISGQADASTHTPVTHMPVLVKSSTKMKQTRIPKASHIPEPRTKQYTNTPSPTLLFQQRNRFFRNSPQRTSPALSAVDVLLTNNNGNNSASRGIKEMSPKTSLMGLREIDQRSIIKGGTESTFVRNTTIFQSKKNHPSNKLERCPKVVHSFGFHSKLKQQHSGDHTSSAANGTPSKLSTKRSPIYKGPRESQNFSTTNQVHGTERTSGISGKKSASYNQTHT